MKILRTLATTSAASLVFLGAGTPAQPAPAAGPDPAPAQLTTCKIRALAPSLGGGRIKGDGDLTCTATVAALQMKVTIQRKYGTRWVNVGVPAQGTRYNVYRVYGTANTSYAPGIYRTKSTGKVLFYGTSTWRPVSAVSAPRVA